MKRKCAALLSLTLAVSLLTGCWDFSEPEESGLVTVLGIDEAEGGNFRVVFQDESLIPGNQMFQASNWNFDIHCGTGSTVFTALQQNLRTNPERAYLAHTKAIVVSEGLVRSQGIGPVIDFLERTTMIRKNTLFLIAKQGEFDKIFLPDAKQDKDTGVIIQKILNEKNSSTFLVQTDLEEFWDFTGARSRRLMLWAWDRPGFISTTKAWTSTIRTPASKRTISTWGTLPFSKAKNGGLAYGR